MTIPLEPRSGALRRLWRVVLTRVRAWGNQRVIAYSSLATAIATIIAVVVTGCLTNAQLKRARDDSFRQFRAYVLFESAEGHAESGDQYIVTLQVRNSGATPAYGVQYWWDANIYDYPTANAWRLLPRYDSVNNKQTYDIGSSTTVVLGDPKQLTITVDDKSHLQTRKKAIYLRARLEYKDTFQRLQCTHVLAVNLPIKADENPRKLTFRMDSHAMDDLSETVICRDP